MPIGFGLSKSTVVSVGKEQSPMILEIDTSKTAGLQFDIQLANSNPNIKIDWGDGTVQTFTTTGVKSRTYAVGGVYQIKITGSVAQIGWGSGTLSGAGLTNYQKLTKIISWGEIFGLKSLAGICKYAINLTEIPNYLPANVNDINNMFAFNTTFNLPAITSWDTSKITQMSLLFSGCTAFNQDISSWNTSNVLQMNNMFQNCSSFNQPLNSWDTGKVTNMQSMFSGASIFNQPLDNWNTSSVITTGMASMFANATTFNQPIGNWNTANVTSMSNMFSQAYAFNQPIGSWNTSKVTNMLSMFYNGGTNTTMAFNQDIGAWDVSKVTTFNSMFRGNSTTSFMSFNNGGSSSINNWNTSSATDMGLMFYRCTPFNQPVGNWNVSNALNLESLFFGCPNFNQDISGWNTANCTNMNAMFSGCTVFNQDISGWNTANVVQMNSMFLNAVAFNQNISGWNVAKINNFGSMFSGASIFNQNLGSWSVANRPVMQNMFGNNLATKAGLSTENYSRTLIGWANQVAAATTTNDYKGKGIDLASGSNTLTYHNVNYGGSPYSDAVSARAYLVGNNTITQPVNGVFTASNRLVACSSDGLTCLAAGASGYAHRSTDGGLTWTNITSIGTSTSSWGACAVSADGTKMALCVANGTIFTSSNSGANWTNRTNSGSRNWTGVAISNDGTRLAACSSVGQIFTSADSGATWTARDSSRSWSSISMSGDGTKLVATVSSTSTTGYVYTSADSGATWTARITDANRAWSSCCYSNNGTTIYAVETTTTNTGSIRKSTDGGANWSTLSGFGTMGLTRGVTCSADGSRILMTIRSSGLGGGMAYSSNGGTSWTQRTVTNGGSTLLTLLSNGLVASNGAYAINFDLMNIPAMSDDGQRIVMRPLVGGSFMRGSPIVVSTDNGVNWSAGTLTGNSGAGWRITDGGLVA